MERVVKGFRSNERAAALIIVLAFVVLFTGLGVAYFSRATSDRQIANSSVKQSSVDQLAQGAMDTIIGDLRQEILNGSGSPSPTASPVTLFVPTSNADMVPRSNHTESSLGNLIRRSLRGENARWPDTTVGPAVASRASAVNSTTHVSANGRSISLARWNSHYLLPKLNIGTDDSTPVDAFANVTPDWVFVIPDPDDPNQEWRKVLTAVDQTVIGRYAFAIYDEGSLVDVNAAGYPSPMTILQYGRKGSLAFADLTALTGFSSSIADNLVGWRNYASSRPTGSFNPLGSGLSFSDSRSTNTYYNFILSDPTYIKLPNYWINGSPPLSYFTNSFLKTSQAPVFNNQTDQALPTRQELLKLRSALSGGGIGFVNALQYLGTFSREGLANIPQWSPTTPDSINPNFQTLLAGPPPTPSPSPVTPAFTRNDGTIAYVGDYFVNRRFLLQRLNWLTYKGPSATRTIPTSAPNINACSLPLAAACAPDYDMWLLTRPDVDSIRFGLTSAFLQQGTAANILKYFGLVWDTTNERWNYTSPSGGAVASSIATLGTLTTTREPDFFELLQAGILNNSLGDPLGIATSSDPALPTVHWESTPAAKMLHVVTVGANLIAQSRADSYPVRIACTVNVGGTPKVMEAIGVPRLPYLSSLAVCPVGVSQITGGVNWFLVPNLWDPFRDTWDLTEANAANNGNGPTLTPGYLRPPVRITVAGNVGFGAATASQSGSVDPASVTSIGTPATGINLSLTLATGNSTFGRDGLRESMRLGASDISGAVTTFNPTNSSSGFAWNDIVRPANDTSTYRTDDFIAFRLSLPGTGIPSGTVSNPVLVLQPGFQVRLEYQSPNGQWYPYSFLQGNNETTTTIGNRNPLSPTNLCLATSFSHYGQPTGYSNPTLITGGVGGGGGSPTLWSDVTGALAHAPMFAKSDPRSIRYNSVIGAINFANPPMTVNSAGIIGPIWPSPYATPPPMTPSGYPAPTPTPNPNPATLGDNVVAGSGSNPYNEFVVPGQANSVGDTWRPVMMNRPFRSVGEMAYAFRDQPFRTLSFSSSNSADAGLLDLFTTNVYSASSGMRGGITNLNSRQGQALAAVLSKTIAREDTPRQMGGAPSAPSPSPSPLGATATINAATFLASLTGGAPVKNKADLPNLIANTNPVGFDATLPKTQRESVARAFGEIIQTRTWNLLFDVIAQTGRYPQNATSLENGFVVDGEQRYWVHVAIDRFTGKVIDKQIEVVNE